MKCDIRKGDCEQYVKQDLKEKIDLTFFDPPFNQNKKYNTYKDNLNPVEYWNWMTRICSDIRKNTSPGGAIYFMQREKNVGEVLSTLKNAGWTFQNIIVWKKMTSAVPIRKGFGKHYQVIVFATNGAPRIFNKLRINLPPLPHEKYIRENGVYITDVWNDIREMTSGYFAGDEPLRHKNKKRVHEQQSPNHLLLRIILSSSMPGDLIFDPFAGTGTTMIVARQLMRKSLGIEIDQDYFAHIKQRIKIPRKADNIVKFYDYYSYTENLKEIWPRDISRKEMINSPLRMKSLWSSSVQ